MPPSLRREFRRQLPRQQSYKLANALGGDAEVAREEFFDLRTASKAIPPSPARLRNLPISWGMNSKPAVAAAVA